MELFRQGLLSEAQLDAYREASPFDSRDPAVLLRDRGLPPPPPWAATPRARLQALFVAARDYLDTLAHPGAADVSACFSRCAAPGELPAARSHPVADRWLEPALTAARALQPHLAQAIANAAPHLAWGIYDPYPRSEIGDGFAEGHAFASIAGEDAPFLAEDLEIGLLLMAPHLVYRDHCHAAPELYAPLTGPHGWRFGPGRSLIVKAAGEPVWNPALQPHLTKVGQVPFLCLFVWTRDVKEPARVIPAGDWAALETAALPIPVQQDLRPADRSW
ncbi:hypothetical protein DK847_09375 [Aestuariivirga litoralis]|uniref:Uncharacterized protein n=2 Tax=Aestuariivirga litoralis TaxID=2650924 RepID=A0A2W2AV54_9HYPH|nr:hypothetical protein DK847_09375 [Aestuariivirga litoralis]